MAQGANQKLSMWRNCSLEPQGQEFFLAASCGAGDGGTGDAQPALSRLPPRDFICPISLDMMTAPVTLVETGQTFDRENLERWFKTGANTCPMTAVTLTSMEMRPNAELLQQMKEWQATGRQRKTMSLPSMPTVPRQAKLPPVGLPPVGAKATAVLASTKSSGLLSARKEEPHTMSLWRLVSCMKPGANAALD